MTILKEEFPFFKRVPRALSEEGISIDSPLEGLSQDLIEKLVVGLTDHLLKERQLFRIAAPGISHIGDIPIAVSVRTRRVRRALSRAGIRTWEDLGTFSVTEFARLPGIGLEAAREVLSALGHVLLSKGLRESRRRLASLGSSPETLESAVDTIRLLSTWAVREKAPAATLGELLGCLEGGLAPSPDLNRRWRQLLKIPLRALLVEQLAVEPLEELAIELLESLEDSERRVYELRVLTHPRWTLEEVGGEMGFTRERARQLQVSAEDCIASLLTSRRYFPLHWRAWRLRKSLGCCAPRDNHVTHQVLASSLSDVQEKLRPILERFLLLLAGPYKERTGWLETEGADEISAAKLMELVDEDGLLPLNVAYTWLSQHEVAPAFRDQWIARSGKLRREGETLLRWSGSVADKSIALLALQGSPADTETLVEAVGEGHSVRGSQNAFLADERLVRVNKTEWALRKWNLEEYTGITDEISQRIEEAGGRALLTDVVDELVDQFGVRASSVRVYAEAPLFVLEDGWVRLRADDEPYPISQDVATCRGVYRWGTDRVSVLIQVDREVLRGSGRTFPSSAAAAVGVLPGNTRRFSWGSESLPITWPLTAALGPSIGSLRSLANAKGAEVGDSLRLDFRPARSSVEAALVPGGIETALGLDSLCLLTGLKSEHDPIDHLASALDVPRSDLRKCLIERGDKVVADLLPAPARDVSLESALADLADSLESERLESE